jgi:hypothetical protein
MPPNNPEHRGKVIDLHQHSAYRPDLAALSRDQVSSARERLGLSRQDFADVLAPLLGWKPSAELVEGWETRATPPGDVILAVGLATQTTRSEVLTVALSAEAEKVVGLMSSVMGEVEKIAGSPDVVRAYAMRGLIGRPKWNGFISGTTQSLWLYGMAEMGYAVDDETPSILRAAAQNGCDIRVLLLDPEYAGITDIDEDEGNPAGTLSPRIRAAHARFLAMRDDCDGQMQVRLYNAPPTVSIVRADHRMLVTPYMRFFAGSNSPTFELVHTPSGNVFNRYTRHFDNMWNLAKEWTG